MALAPKVKLAVLNDNVSTYRKEIAGFQCLIAASLDDLARLAEDTMLKYISSEKSLFEALSLMREWIVAEFLSAGVFQNDNEKYVFSQLLVNRLSAKDLPILSVLIPEFATGKTVSFVQNRMIDTILRELTADLNLTHSLCASDFKEAISSVVDGETEFCILPHANYGLQQISSLFDATYENGLFLSLLVCDEETSLGFYGKRAYPICNEQGSEVVLQVLSPKDSANCIYQYTNSNHIERFSYRKDTIEYFVDTFKVKSVSDAVSIALHMYLFNSHVKLIGFAQIIKV